MSDHNQLAREALAAALKVRVKFNKNLADPICVYDLVESLNVELKFVDISSMEGMYSGGGNPVILLASDRPSGRRVYTCGHELGHHHFAHGTRVDELRDDDSRETILNPEEFLVQAFSGFLLMPKLAVCNAFAIRGWDPKLATPEQIYRISNLFGVTYTALITHMSSTLNLLPRYSAQQLSKFKLQEIRQQFIGLQKAPLIVADGFWKGRPIDLEVDDLLHLPPGGIHEGNCLAQIDKTQTGEIVKATRPGHGRVYNQSTGWSSFVRVSRKCFVGRSIYRHFEEVDDE